jgi:Na+-transporting NADH:ubiquinone oxidoreductase subunit NqrA
MSKSIKLKKGFDLRLEGAAEQILGTEVNPELYGVKPVDFPGLTPKLNVKEGERISAGSALFHDKIHPEILFTSPVSGIVVSITRGERRRLLEIVIRKEGENLVDFGKSDPSELSGEQIRETLLKSGLWPSVRQRPYNVIANPSDSPKSIFISGFDSAPLAPDYSFIMNNSSASTFKHGISALKKLTGGKINLILNGKGRNSEVLEKSANVEISYFSGPHPSGNTGVHIHHLDPLNKGEVVWVVNLQDVLANYYEFFGWMKPGLNKFSFSKTFLSKLIPKKQYALDTNMHGGERAFVMTGQYEKVVPMDIYPMQLLKAILAEDIELMENLGIYEVAEEDFALCEFICPSKIEIQSIVRKGLDLMIREMN